MIYYAECQGDLRAKFFKNNIFFKLIYYSMADNRQGCNYDNEKAQSALQDGYCNFGLAQNLWASIVAHTLCAGKSREEINAILQFFHILTSLIKAYL